MAAQINLKVTSNFDQASKDIKQFGAVTEAQAKKLKKFQEEFKTERIDNFIDRQNRARAAVTATKGPVEALRQEQRAYQREIERLIKNGLDPMDDQLKKLRTRYDQLNDEIDQNTGSLKKNEKASAVSAASYLFIAQQAIQAGKAVFDFTKQFIDAASAAEEIGNKFNVTFQGITDLANNTAEELAHSFGLSDVAAQSLLANTGDLLTGFGFTRESALDLSKQVQKLSGDLASFQNLETADVSDRITKALTGETESLKALGVVIRQDTREYKDLVEGIQEAEGVSLVQAKSLANLQIITEQSGNAIGDFARSQDSFANQTRIAEAEIENLVVALGQSLLPEATEAAKIFGQVAKELANIAQESNDLHDAYEAVANGTETTEQKLVALNATLEQQKGARDLAKGLTQSTAAIDAQIKATEAAISAAQARLSEEEAAAEFEGRRAKFNETQAARRAQIAEAEALIAAEQAQIALDRQTEDEKRIDAINLEITRLADLRTVARNAGVSYAGIQEELNRLVEERTSLMGEEEKATEALISTGQNLIGEALVPMTEAAREMWKAYGEGIAAADDATEEATSKLKEYFEELTATDVVGAFMDITSAIDDIIQASSDKRIALIEAERDAHLQGIDDRLQAELEAEGVAEETKLERLNKELQAAFAEGDAETIKELQDEIKRTEITEKYAAERADAEKEFAKEVAQAEYEAALAGWKIQSAQAVAATALGIAKAIPNPFLMAAAGAAGAVQIAAVQGAKPEAPTFQTGTLPSGFTVPESASTRGDSTAIAVQPGETVSVSPRGEGGMGKVEVNVIMNDEVLETQVQSLIDSNRLTFTTDNLRSA